MLFYRSLFCFVYILQNRSPYTLTQYIRSPVRIFHHHYQCCTRLHVSPLRINWSCFEHRLIAQAHVRTWMRKPTRFANIHFGCAFKKTVSKIRVICTGMTTQWIFKLKHDINYMEIAHVVCFWGYTYFKLILFQTIKRSVLHAYI